jgi:DNA-binding HxlR family transcriptional regulator
MARIEMKGRKTDLGQATCAIARTLDLIGDWWSLLIIRDAFLGSQRFGEFQKNIGLAKNILSSRLKKLVQGGIFNLEEDRGAPSVHRYVLTGRGKQLAVIITAIWQWGEENCFQPGELDFGLADAASGQMLAKMEIKTVDGRILEPHQLEMTLKQKVPRNSRRQRRPIT